MKYTSYEARKNFCPGDEIWACDYQYHSNKEGHYLHQEPILGIFAVAHNKILYNETTMSKGGQDSVFHSEAKPQLVTRTFQCFEQ